jgi:hypothetical protein
MEYGLVEKEKAVKDAPWWQSLWGKERVREHS